VPKILGLSNRSKNVQLQGGVYSFKVFPAGVTAAFSGRAFDPSKTESFLSTLTPSPVRFSALKQMHENRVVKALPVSDPWGEGEGDGLVTREKNLALTIRTADCASIFFSDPAEEAIGICHAGWRGARCGITFELVEKMKAQFNSEPKTLLAAIGPVICRSCYEVGEEFEGYFPREVFRINGKPHLDLKAVLLRQLKEAGLTPDRIFDSNFCTACSTGQFFSARREGKG